MVSDDFYHEMGDNAENPQMYRKHGVQLQENENLSMVDISSEIEQRSNENGATGFYYHSEKIGEAKQHGRDYMYEMAEGFEFKNNKFYQKAGKQKNSYPESYVEGCDMGWC